MTTAKLLVISEEWSSDCRRDVPMLARLAEAGGLELRIFPRDGPKVGRGPRANPDESPTADIMNEFLNLKDGQTWQSIPVAVFYTKDLECLYRYTEFIRDWTALQQSAFPRMWAGAAVYQILSALYERIVLGWRDAGEIRHQHKRGGRHG